MVGEHHVQGVKQGVHGGCVARYLRGQDEVIEVDIDVLKRLLVVTKNYRRGVEGGWARLLELRVIV
jgi:hypothetical protein